MRGPWEYEDPSCASVGGNFWFPERDAGNIGLTVVNFQSEEAKIARNVCGSCTHKIECQQWGLKHEKYGIWGALTEGEREPIRKRLNIIVEEVGLANLAESLGNSTHQSNTST